MDIEKIAMKLRSAHEQINPIIEKRNKIIKQEAMVLKELYKKLIPFSTSKEINGSRSLLIFMYANSDLDLISDEVYLNHEGMITYQCFNQNTYREIVPNAQIKNGYVEISLEYFLENVPLIKILNFLDQRPAVLTERAYNIEELNEKRINLIKFIKQTH